MTTLVRAASLLEYANLAKECGVDPDAAMARVKLSKHQLEDVDSLIPYISFINLIEFTAQEGNSRDFGLRLAQRQGMKILGQLALLFQHASCLGEALSLASRYIFVHSPAVKLSIQPVVDAPEYVDLIFSLDIKSLPPHPQVLELSLGIITGSVASVGQKFIKPVLAQLPHAAIGSETEYAKTFGCPMVFHAPITALRIAADDLRKRLPEHNAALQNAVQTYIDTHFNDPAQHFSDHIRSMVRRFLSSGMGKQASIAKALSISTKSLQRRLAAEGYYFEDIVDEIRKQQLLEYLQQPDPTTITQISRLLGYTESSTLIRSCHRWFHCTPETLRSNLVAEKIVLTTTRRK